MVESLLGSTIMTWTTAMLSHSARTDLYCQCLPQTATARTMGTSSLTAI